RSDGEFVDVAVLGPAAACDLGIDFLARVLFLLREIEDITVGIVAAIGGEGPRRGPLHDCRVVMLPLHALQHGFDVVDHHAEMIDSLDIAVASRNEVQTHIAVADGDRRCRAALGGRLQPEHGLVELAERVVLVADDGHVIDLGETLQWGQNLPCCGGWTRLPWSLTLTPPDGRTVALGATTILAVSPHLNSKLPYDPLKDFAPIALLARVPIVMVVNAAVPARSVAEFVALARAHPGKLNYGSIGNGSTGHLLGEMLRRTAGIDIVHVPYKGAAPGVNALLAGDVQLFFFPVFVDAAALVRSGALRPLALVDSRRSPVAPDLPTLPELGYPLEAAAWF